MRQHAQPHDAAGGEGRDMKALACRPDILTFSGRYFDLFNPAGNEVRLEDIAQGLANTCRFAGQCCAFYSVAQHSVMASYLVPPEDKFAALMHDAAEAYLGDVTRPLKQMLPDYLAIEARVEAYVFEQLGLSLPLPPSVKRADLVMLATEQRDLMPDHDDEWALIAEVEPLWERILPLPPSTARGMFIERAMSLAEAGLAPEAFCRAVALETTP